MNKKRTVAEVLLWIFLLICLTGAVSSIGTYIFQQYRKIQAQAEEYDRKYNPPGLSDMCRLDFNCLECHEPVGMKY